MGKFFSSMALSIVAAALFAISGALQLGDGKTLVAFLLFGAAALWVVNAFMRSAERKKQDPTASADQKSH